MDETHAEADQSQSASILPKNYTFFGSYDHSLDPKGRIIIRRRQRERSWEGVRPEVSSM